MEDGENVDVYKNFTPTTGVKNHRATKDIHSYSETRGGITLGWKWGNFTFAKDFLNIGSIVFGASSKKEYCTVS